MNQNFLAIITKKNETLTALFYKSLTVFYFNSNLTPKSTHLLNCSFYNAFINHQEPTKKHYHRNYKNLLKNVFKKKTKKCSKILHITTI